MMNRLRQFCLTALMCTAMLAHADGIVRWLEMQHEFGTIHEEDGKVSCTMRLVNDGDSELIITQVRTSCGCTAAGYDKAPIAPGDTARITITYDPVARPGEFSKDVFVYTNGTPRRSGVSIHGVVIAQPETLSEFYPVAVGAMRMTGASVPLGELTKGRKRSSYLTVVNTSTTDTLLVSVTGENAHLKAAAAPDTLPPGKVGAVTVMFDTRQSQLWGLNIDTLTIITEPLHPSPTAMSGTAHFHVMAQVLDDYSQLTDQQRRDAPAIKVSTDKLMFARDALSATMTVTNTGKKPLELRRVWTAEPGVSISCGKTRLKHGKQATITITIDPTLVSRPLLNGHMTIVSNDPSQQSLTVRLVGEI